MIFGPYWFGHVVQALEWFLLGVPSLDAEGDGNSSTSWAPFLGDGVTKHARKIGM